jgi:hypothetical protein
MEMVYNKLRDKTVINRWGDNYKDVGGRANEFCKTLY